jgi:predicted amidohydrolase YtcJ
LAARLTTDFVVAIVAATLIAGLIVGAQRDDNSGPVDLIIHNAHVYTADAHGTMAQALAVRGNTILHVGSDREVMRFRRPQTEVIDANGAAVLPGFNDSHASLVAEGFALQDVDLTDAATIDDVRLRIAAWAETHPEAAWIRGRGMPIPAFASLTRTDLDDIVADRPVVLQAQDGSQAWVNSAALRAARVTRKAARSESADVVRDRRGEPTGVVRGAALDLIRRAMPAPSRDDRGEALSAALDQAPRRGITSVQDFVETTADLDLYGDLKADTRDHEDVRVYIAVPVTPGPAAASELDALAQRFPDDPSIKTGVAYIRAGTTAEDLERTVAEIDRQQWQVAVETPDAASVRGALDAFDAAARANTDRSADRRDRLEGVRDVNQEDLARFKRGRWIAVLLPSQMPAPTSVIAAAGPSLDVLHWPARSLDKAGAHLAFGTGDPSSPASPLASIAAVVARQDAPDEALALKAAINAWTSHAAWASFDEHRKGTLEPGMLADIVVLSDDIFKMRPQAISSASVDVTIIDGRVVYRRKTS